MKKERLTIEDRILIEELLRQNYKLKDIARAIGVESSTISREIKNRRISNNSLVLCEQTNRYPFICFNCSKKASCKKEKYYYNYKEAQKIMKINSNIQELELICLLMKLNTGMTILKIN